MNTSVPANGWLTRLRQIWANPILRIVMLTLYYLIIIAALILLYGRGDFSTPSFIYVGF